MGVRDLLKACSTDAMLLDALHQWATTPTGHAAVHRGFPPDHTRIQQNLAIRYSLTVEQAGRVYQALVQEVEASGLPFAGGYLEAEPLVRRSLEISGTLREKTMSRLARASDREKWIVWLFCRLKGDYSLWPHSRDYHAYHEKMHRFLAVLNATFGLTAEAEEVLLTLIRLGFINELQWVNATLGGSRRENELVFPSYLEDTSRHIEEQIRLPDLPDPSVFLDRLFSRSDGETLAALEELLKRGWMAKKEVPREMGTHPCIVGHREGILAINCRLLERLRRELRARKQVELAEAENRVAPALDAFSETPVQDAIEGGEGVRVWRIPSPERSTIILLAPWLTEGDMERLRALPPPVCLVLIATMLSVPNLERLHREVFFASPSQDGARSWIFVALSRGTASDRVFQHCPPGYDRFLDRLRQSDLGSRRHVEGSALSVFLGRSSSGAGVHWRPGDLQNGHFLIVGGTGAGKTETIRCITAELDRQGYPVLLIDFHGDMEGSNQQTYTIREGSRYYFNPLELDPAFEEITPLRATSDFVDAMSINFPTLGIQQREQLKQFIRQAYRKGGISKEPSTWGEELDFTTVEEEMEKSDSRTAQTLSAYLADAFLYRLFSGEEKIELNSVLRPGVTRLNLRGLPESLRFLYADLFLRKLYYVLQAMGEIARKPAGDRERFRLFVIVDEAKLLVSERQGIKAVLNKYTSELRKFGVGLILASQLVGHFPEEVLANIEVKLCMKAQNGEQSRRNARFFGMANGDLLGLHQGEGILILDGERLRLKIVPTWERADIQPPEHL